MKQDVIDLKEARDARQMAELSQRVPKRELVLYLGRSYFGDNSKYVFLKHLEAGGDVEALWCTCDDDLADRLEAQGLPVLRILEDVNETITTFMQASVVVLCENPVVALRGLDVLAACLEGAYKIQLWHGVSVKHLVFDLATHLGFTDDGFRKSLSYSARADAVLSTAARFDRYWARTFGCRTLVRANQPRNAVLVRTPQPLELIGSQMHDEGMAALADPARTRVLVAPTWQRNSSLYTMRGEFLQECATFAREHDVDVFYKGHPMIQQGFDGHTKVGNLYLVDPAVDIYPHLTSFDALVTDYSSIMFDFLYVDSPILTLDIASGEHETFEPDFSLVPCTDFSERFSSVNFTRTLEAALTDDARADQRGELRRDIFETDPETAPADALSAVLARSADVVEPALDVLG